MAQILLEESDTQLHLTKNLVSEKQELVSSLEENLTKFQSELAEQEKKLNDILQVEVCYASSCPGLFNLPYLVQVFFFKCNISPFAGKH